MRISDSLGPKRVVHWAWGWDQFQKGFYPATERIVLVQHHGRVAWIEDILSASSKNCHSPSCRKALPIELLITPDQGVRRAHLVGERRVVLRPVSPQHVPYAAGVPWWTTAGDYEPAQQHGALTEITSTYHSGGQALTEIGLDHDVDTALRQVGVHVANGHGHPGYGFRNADDAAREGTALPEVQPVPAVDDVVVAGPTSLGAPAVAASGFGRLDCARGGRTPSG